jgi:hypothetical protein
VQAIRFAANLYAAISVAPALVSRLVFQDSQRRSAVIPSGLFYDLVDSQIAFKIVQRNFNSPNFIFSVPRVKDGQLRLTMLGSQPLVGSADAILARLNALLCEHPVRQPNAHAFRPATSNAKIVGYSIFPEAEKGKQHGLPEEMSVECRIMPADRSNPGREISMVSVIVDGKHSLHLMETVGKDNLQEISRLSPHALPMEIHGGLAANGYYQESFVTLYGEEALEEAKTKLREACNRAGSAGADARHAHH